MLCERCQQRQATVHITEIINNLKNEKHLCEVCAQEIQAEKFNLAPPFTLHNFLAGLLHSEFGTEAFSKPARQELKCENCGLVESQFIKRGLLGCGECYRYFRERLEPVLRRIHGSSTHTGKVPEHIKGRISVTREIEQLKLQLKEAINKEEFEQAARLRDSIRELEDKLSREG